ncbi:Fibronectin type III-like domain [Dillenia turbinata]|uniref:Fibronectin type III-like domain n=1 Tax=Dillenia turbinata TaxID=194707 RepID=A0AAN8VN11_9MAGN
MQVAIIKYSMRIHTSPLDAFSSFGKLGYATGRADIATKNDSLTFPATKAAKKAEATILFIGLDLTVEAEGVDRENLLLPYYQTLLINQVAEIQAILWAGYPGEEGGSAFADVVFGHYNPATNALLLHLQKDGFSINLNKYQHCRHITCQNRTCRPSCLAVLVDDLSCDNHHFEFEVHSMGRGDGNEVVIVYSRPRTGIVGIHAKQVIGFQSVSVRVGSGQKVKFQFNACKSFGIVDATGYSLLPMGNFGWRR